MATFNGSRVAVRLLVWGRWDYCDGRSSDALGFIGINDWYGPRIVVKSMVSDKKFLVVVAVSDGRGCGIRIWAKVENAEWAQWIVGCRYGRDRAARWW